MDGVVDKLENLVTFKSRAKQDSTDFEEPDILVSAWLNTDAEVYQKLGFVYDTELMVTTQHKGSSTVILEQHTKQNIVGLERIYTTKSLKQIIMTEEVNVIPSIKKKLVKKKWGPYSPIMFESTGLMLIEYCDVLLDENGEYHFVLEVVEQEFNLIIVGNMFTHGHEFTYIYRWIKNMKLHHLI